MFRLDAADENGIIRVNADEVFKNYYMDYAKSVIVDRSFPHIDGFNAHHTPGYYHQRD